jgi:putative flavoprotein involved in K+ transport
MLDLADCSEERKIIGVVTGVRGGYDIDVGRFRTNGVTLLGHLQGVEGEKLAFALDVEQTLTRADEYCQRSLRSVDDYIQKTGLNEPAPDTPPAGATVPTTPASPDLARARSESLRRERITSDLVLCES